MPACKTVVSSLVLVAWLTSVSFADAEVRTWTDSSGQFKREASLQRLNGNAVVLKTVNGQELTIPLERLSTTDQAYVKKAAASAATEDPFEAAERPFGEMPSSEARPTAADVRVVIASGVGTTVEEAKKDAYREAVRQVVGAYVEGDTLVRNDELIEDKVLALSGALVTKADIVADSITTRAGLTRLRIRAEVKITEVMKSLATNKITTTAVRTPDLAAQIATTVDQAQTAQEMLNDSKMWEGFPASFFKIASVGQPKVVKTNGDNATVEIMVRITPDSQQYLAFARRMTAILSKLGGAGGAFTVDGNSPACRPESRKEVVAALWRHALVASRNRGNGAEGEIAYAFPQHEREELQAHFEDMGTQIATNSDCLVYCFNQASDYSMDGCGLRQSAEKWHSAIGRKRDELMIVCLMTQANERYNRTKWEWFTCAQSLFPQGEDSPWLRHVECEIGLFGSGGKEITTESLPLYNGFGVSKADWQYYPPVLMLGPMWIECSGEDKERYAYVPQFTFPRRIELSAAEAASIAEVKCLVRPSR